MKILHVITSLSAGGAQRALYNSLSGGLAEQFSSSVLSLRDKGTIGPQIQELGVPVYMLNMSPGLPGPKVLVQLRQIVRSLQPDVIQGWMYHGNIAGSLGGKFASGRPAVVWNVRHSLYSLANEKLLTRQVIRGGRWLSGRADTIVYNSQVSRTQHESFGFAGARGIVIPNGFDLGRLRPDEVTRAAVRHEFGIPDAAPVIGHVARFHPMKDHASFLRAAARVALANSAVRFLVVGREVSPENAALAGIVPPEVMARFIFTGERQDVHRLMQSMDVLCTSSAWGEAFPNVIGEAMACGVPCVVTNVGDSAAIVGETGFVIAPRDSGKLAVALEKMLQMSSADRAFMGRAARARMEQYFRLEDVVEQYASLYNDV